MWIMTHNFTIFARSRFALVSIYYKILWSSVRWLIHERPFHATRESSASAASQSRSFNFIQDPVCAFFNYLLCFVPISTLHRSLQSPIVTSIQICKDSVLIREITESCSRLWRRCRHLCRIISQWN
jgi:hypothetical protein